METDGISRCASGTSDSGGRASASASSSELRPISRAIVADHAERLRRDPGIRERALAPHPQHRRRRVECCAAVAAPDAGDDRRAARISAQRQQQRRAGLAGNEPRRVARARDAPRRHLARQARRRHQRIDPDEEAGRPLLRREALLHEREAHPEAPRVLPR